MCVKIRFIEKNLYKLRDKAKMLEMRERIFKKLINGGGVQNKVRGCVNFFQKLINGPPPSYFGPKSRYFSIPSKKFRAGFLAGLELGVNF